ncbi:MAG: General stress protein 69 [Candidatus Ordinivivax streblomastigis]|uniref:General stress protein 69 n=1 Tax=Candidatus Ordinivivax streblomastigis TaxID=2540710 RepID=A0A5M8NTM5_9BACT|nr:MAG: General stress protein 69 [Candidatus Ordinivivax streblomastigis]
MKKVKLGKSGIEVSAMTIGCWSFGGGDYWGEQSQKDVDSVVNTALDLGVNTFDTAEMYNNGASEISLGKALKGRRDEAIVISKTGPDNAGRVREHCIKSLQRLGMDYLDVYMLHWPINKLAVKHFTSDTSEVLPTIEEAYAQLDALKKEGLIRTIGMSNFGRKQMEEVVHTGIQIDVNEMVYNILSRAIEAEIAPYCLEKNISIIGAMGLQQGLLAGIYKTPDDVPANQARSRHFSNNHGGGASRHGEDGAEKEMFSTLEQLQKIADDLHVHIAQLSIAWILKKPFMVSTLVGSRNINELQINVEACSLDISDETEQLIDKISQPVLDILGNNPDYYENSLNSRIF